MSVDKQGGVDAHLSPPHHYEIFRPFQDMLDLGGAAPNVFDGVQAANTESDWIDCAGKYGIVLVPELSAANVTAKIRVIFKDGNAVPGRTYTRKMLLRNTGDNTEIRETGYYHGESEPLSPKGATAFKVLLTEAPTNGGFLSLWAAVI
jgi:hypothetical protein